MSRSLLTIWRRQYRDGELGGETPPAFIPLTVLPKAPATGQEAPRDTPDVQLDVVLRNGWRFLVSSAVDPKVLARLLPVLEGR